MAGVASVQPLLSFWVAESATVSRLEITESLDDFCYGFQVAVTF